MLLEVDKNLPVLKVALISAKNSEKGSTIFSAAKIEDSH